MSPKVALVDCNSFFCSCEQLFAPRLQKKPVVVLSNNDGCVIARTREAKALGIPMGVPYFEIREKLIKDNVHVFSSNYALYGDISSRVMRTLSEITPELEIYSVDEAFLNLEGFQNVEALAHQIRDKILKNIGIPTSVGIAPTKVLAKVANKVAKSLGSGVFDLSDPEKQVEILSTFPAEDIWGIGRKSAEKLRIRGIKTALQLRNAPEAQANKLLTIVGARIVKELRGEPCLPLELIQKERKEICCARGFGKKVSTFEKLEEALTLYVSRSAERLRKRKQLCTTVTVFIQTDPFSNQNRYFNCTAATMTQSSNATDVLNRQAVALLKKIYRPGFEYKRIGVIFSGLTLFQQLGLWDFKQNNDAKRMAAIDAINAKMGQDTLRLATIPYNPLWKALSKMRSPSYTTQWDQLLSTSI